jgi:hypothetical protein
VSASTFYLLELWPTIAPRAPRRMRIKTLWIEKGLVGGSIDLDAALATGIGSLASRIWVDPFHDACYDSVRVEPTGFFMLRNSGDGSHYLNFFIYSSLSAQRAFTGLPYYSATLIPNSFVTMQRGYPGKHYRSSAIP